MKLERNPFVHFVPIVVFVALSPLHAADVNTTGGTTVVNTDAPGNRYLGNGILQVSTDGVDGQITLGTTAGSPNTEFALTSGGLITIDSGVSLVNGGWSKGVWTNNKADMQLNGTLDMWDGNPVFVNALNGSGSVLTNWPWGGSVRQLNVGVDGGSGTFSGSIEGYDFIANSFIRVTKSGAGTQVFNNLGSQGAHQMVVNAGVLELAAASNAAMPTQFFGAGSLVKSGAGALTLSGAMMGSGTTTVSGGSLGFSSEISARSNLVAATGTSLALNFTGQATVATLSLGGSGPLAAGIYDSTHGTYGSYFTGTGQLNVLNGAVPSGSGTWASPTGGFWNVSARWQTGSIANGSNNTATIGAASAISVTLDSDVTLGHVVFQANNHTLNGDSALTLAGTTPSVSVASGTSSRIETQIAGSSGLAKTGAGTLTLAGSNKTYTGGTAVNAGRLVLADLLTGTANYTIASGATLEFNSTGTTNRQLSGGTISGSGNLVKSGNGRVMLGASGARQNIALDSGALIDVQAGVLRGEFGNFSGGVNGWLNNKADLNVASGAFFDIWDSNGIVDAINGTGTINKGWSANSSLTFGVDNGSGTFSGPISQGSQSYGGANGGTFSLIKNGSGTQIFTGTNTYTGTTTVNAGTLLINGNSSAATGLVTVQTGGTLGGTGTIGGAVTVAAAGNLSPGASAGTLGILGVLNLSALAGDTTGKLNFELGPIADSDKIAVTSGLTIDGLAFSDFNFSALTGLENGTYTLITSSGITGALDPDVPDLTGTIGAGPAQGTLQINGNNIELLVSGVGPADPYLAWAGPGVLFDQDANNDGVRNGLAWLLGAANPNENAVGRLPVPTQTGGSLKLVFDCLAGAERGTAQLNVQHSSDMGISDAWTSASAPGVEGGPTTINGVDFIVTDPAPVGGLLRVEATISSAQAASGKLFGRLRSEK